jgi:TRAP-type mannitol/chloroaromatic compound transport system substrate-binding protein
MRSNIGRAALGAVGVLAAIGVGAAGAQERVSWKLASAYPSTLPVLGPAPFDTAEILATITGDALDIRVYEPGALVPPLETFDAVAKGSIDAGYTAGTFWAGKDVTFNIFSAIPFGPAADEYLAWMRHGGGLELQDELYAEHNLKSVLCGVVTPEAAGWFRNEITGVDDLKGLKMRFAGLGARVIGELGVSPQLLAPGDIYLALETGTIDATEFSTPAADASLGFHEIADYYYFPGWHQQSAFAQMLINLDAWNGLSEAHRTAIETACDATITRTLAAGEAAQAQALAELEAKGAKVSMLPDAVLAALEDAWTDTVAELSAESAPFKGAWDSYRSFRENYRRWREVGYLD